MVEKGKTTLPGKLKGFRDYYDKHAEKRRWITDQVLNHAKMAGYHSLSTPSLEKSDVLLGPGGQEIEKEVYRFKDHGNRDVALRFDLTVPFARFVAENLGQLPLPLKKVQVGEVWRGEKPQKGRYREFCQADVDLVGEDSLLADIDIISLLGNLLGIVVPQPVTITLGHRTILSGLISTLFSQMDRSHENTVLTILDKMGKIPLDKMNELLQNVPGVETSSASDLLHLLTKVDEKGDSHLDEIQQAVATNTKATDEITRFKETIELLREIESPVRYRVNMSIARGLGYYTGIVFESIVDDLPNLGSVSSGGRYNQLISRFSPQNIPGIGGSIGVDRVLSVWEEKEKEAENHRKGVFLIPVHQPARAFAYSLGQKLRENGTTVDLSVSDRKLANQFKYADRCCFRFVIVIGEDEWKDRVVSVKDLQTGKQNSKVNPDQLANIIGMEP